MNDDNTLIATQCNSQRVEYGLDQHFITPHKLSDPSSCAEPGMDRGDAQHLLTTSKHEIGAAYDTFGGIP